MLQVKIRNDTKRGVRFMATMCLYQDTRHEKSLLWMREILGIGYISRRNDGISELRINGFSQVKNILQKLKPFIRFKAQQAELLIRACTLLETKSIALLSDGELRTLVGIIFAIKDTNYKSRSTLTKKELCRRLGLTP